MSSTPPSSNLLPQRKFEDYFPSDPKSDVSTKPTLVVSPRPYIAPVFVGHVGHIGQFNRPILVTKDGHVLVCQIGISPYDPFVRMAPHLVRY